MRIFVTGATGFIGSAVVRDLVAAGHEVTGLARSANAVAALESLGAKACRGTIDDLEVLRRAAAAADGVIHTAFFHALSHASFGARVRIMFGGRPTQIVRRFTSAAVATELCAIETFGGALCPQKGALVIAFPTMAMASGRPALETDLADSASVGGSRASSERAALELVGTDVRATVVRLPPSVHDQTRLGLVSRLIRLAQKRGISAYSGEGCNRWAAVHRLDASLLFRLALENGKAGARYHAVAEEGIPFRDIAKAIGRRLDVPVVALSSEESDTHFGWLAPFVGADNPVSGLSTREQLRWEPQHPQLMTDLAAALNEARR
jgi:nucleoside-diphosphate-sugar epimerase